ncbi:MAG: hypothetical protein AB1648_05930 [Pseudomonadota bacterium]|jgi:pterin-4a-carbinolamine dehydratase
MRIEKEPPEAAWRHPDVSMTNAHVIVKPVTLSAHCVTDKNSA